VINNAQYCLHVAERVGVGGGGGGLQASLN
jgi:hypothetical protein